MQSTTEKCVAFYDRLSLVQRRKSNGKLEQVGGDEGGIKIRIRNNNPPILTLHLMSSLVASAAITKFDIVSVSGDGYCIHLYLDEYSIHKVRRMYALHFSNDEIASKKFFDTYISVLSPDVQIVCPSFFDLMGAGEVEQVKTKMKDDFVYDNDGNNDCAGNKEEVSQSNNEASDGLNLDGGYEFQESQDVYADNCLITIPKKW